MLKIVGTKKHPQGFYVAPRRRGAKRRDNRVSKFALCEIVQQLFTLSLLPLEQRLHCAVSFVPSPSGTMLALLLFMHLVRLDTKYLANMVCNCGRHGVCWSMRLVLQCLVSETTFDACVYFVASYCDPWGWLLHRRTQRGVWFPSEYRMSLQSYHMRYCVVGWCESF